MRVDEERHPDGNNFGRLLSRRMINAVSMRILKAFGETKATHPYGFKSLKALEVNYWPNEISSPMINVVGLQPKTPVVTLSSLTEIVCMLCGSHTEPVSQVVIISK